jgi:hypothetical protein
VGMLRNESSLQLPDLGLEWREMPLAGDGWDNQPAARDALPVYAREMTLRVQCVEIQVPVVWACHRLCKLWEFHLEPLAKLPCYHCYFVRAPLTGSQSALSAFPRDRTATTTRSN